VDAEIGASESLYRLLIENTHEGVRVIDTKGRTTYVNPCMAGMLGYTQEEMVGRNAWDFVWPEDVPAWKAAFARRKRHDGVQAFDVRLRRKDGTFLWCHANTNIIRAADGRAVGFFAMYADITERKQAEQALRASEQRLQLALDAGGMGIWAWDLRAGCTVWNAKEYELLGLPPGEGVLDGEVFFPYVHPEDRPELRRLVSELIERGTELVSEFRINRADGQVRWLAAVGRLIRDEAGRPLSLIGVNYDITERKQAEQRLKALNETLERRVAARTAEAERRALQLRRLAAELTRTEQGERRRLAQRLHDQLQQTLVAAKLGVDRLQRRLGQPDQPRLLENVRQLLAELLEVSRSLTAELSPPILHEGTFAQALRWLGRRAADKYGLKVRVAADEAAEPANHEVRVLLFRAVEELLLNIVKHAGVGRAQVQLSRRGQGHVRIRVADKGAGFDPVKEKRAEEAASADSHFGLFSIRERLELLGGTMEIESQPGNGTRVILSVPPRLPGGNDGWARP